MSRAKIKELQSKIEALVLGVVREQEAYDFYMEVGKQYEDKASIEMFEYLARQELQHKTNLESILKGIERQLEEEKVK